MTLNIHRTRGLFSKPISFSIGVSALTALVPLAVAQADDGYLEVVITNHPNNVQLGELYLYVGAYNHISTSLDIPEGTNKGHYTNGSGKTYLVDDYKDRSLTNSQMSRHGPDATPADQPYKWHGFRMTGTSDSEGLIFTLGFGCDPRSRGQICEANHDYTFLDEYEGCINYDNPRLIIPPCLSGEFNGNTFVPYTTVNSYDMDMGFNQRTAQFELAFWTKGLGKDLGDITSINWYGFPMEILSGHRHSTDPGVPWINGTAKSYSRNDHWIRTNLQSAMAINSSGTPPGSSWYLKLLDDKFVRANSPQQFPNIAGNPPPTTNHWFPVPSGYEFSPDYLNHLKSLDKYKCATTEGGWTINGPWASVHDEAPTYMGGSNISNSFHCKACFNDDGSITVCDFSTLTNAANPPIDAAQSYDIQVTIPNKTNAAGWNTIQRLILGGDPCSADATLKYRAKTPPGSPWDTSGNPCGSTPYHIDGVDYTNAIKAATGRMLSYPIQFGWLDNYLEVEWQTSDSIGHYKGTYPHQGIAIESLPVGAMQWLAPIYEFYKDGGVEMAGWYDNYGATIFDAQKSDNLVAYFQPYTDSYKYGNVQVPTHNDKYNKVWITIKDLTDACKSDLNNNGQNDLEDILILFECWGKIDCDLNEDSTTNVLDLLQMLKDWGLCTQTGGG